ncbi:uncharacterized protein LOC106093941 [Stomoxys calcitrans]|uniref:uncharacterized protein LOC106093941 n=1 Tax=Stomoxys calcitrans TaxID=35570 RepID=UPI0027E24D75|nr:uncharacterized protein LOC106093941 [Stomoxys calcitrans]XP_059225563.1 uncharacterized protein LOC106093941 [Stomoxys calcitrans]
MSCCCSLPTWAIVIGVLQCLGCFAATVYIAFVMIQIAFIQNTEIIMLQMSSILVFVLIALAFTITMIVGVMKKRYRLISPYLWFCLIAIILYVILQVVAMVILITTLDDVPTHHIVIYVLRSAASVCIQLLFMFPSYRVYKRYRAEAMDPVTGLQEVYATAPIVYQNAYGSEKTHF